MTRSAFAERIDAAREYFVLRAAEKRAHEIPPEKRTAMGRTLGLARQKREAAEILWLAAEVAEAVRLAREAFLLAYQATSDAKVAGTEPIDALAKSTEAETTPELDAEIRDTHKARFREWIDAVDVLESRNVLLTLEPRELRVRRVQRALVALLAFVGVVAFMWFVLHTPRTLRAEASGVYAADRFAAANAVDGREDTEWLLPDRVGGWLDVWVGPPRKLQSVKILNAHNPPYNDRATKDWHIDVFAKGNPTPVKSLDGSFEFSESPNWLTLPLGVDAVERIHLEVKSVHKNGGGIAEINVQ